MQKNENNIWELGANNNSREEFGCAYAPLDHPSRSYNWFYKNLDLVIWNHYSPKFPMQYKPIRFRVRHAGDPLIKAIDISKHFGSIKET